MLHGQTRMRPIQILEHKPITQQKLSLRNEDVWSNILVLAVTISDKKEIWISTVLLRKDSYFCQLS